MAFNGKPDQTHLIDPDVSTVLFLTGNERRTLTLERLKVHYVSIFEFDTSKTDKRRDSICTDTGMEIIHSSRT